MKSEIVTRMAKERLDTITNDVVDFVGDLTMKLGGQEEGEFDWEIFLNTNMILINGLMHHYIENHLKVMGRSGLSEYIDTLDDNLNRIKLYYAEANKQIN